MKPDYTNIRQNLAIITNEERKQAQKEKSGTNDLTKKVLTEVNKKLEEATDIEGDVRNEFPVLPVRLHGDPHVHCVRDSPRPSHSVSYSAKLLNAKEIRSEGQKG